MKKFNQLNVTLNISLSIPNAYWNAPSEVPAHLKQMLLESVKGYYRDDGVGIALGECFAQWEPNEEVRKE